MTNEPRKCAYCSKHHWSIIGSVQFQVLLCNKCLAELQDMGARTVNTGQAMRMLGDWCTPNHIRRYVKKGELVTTKETEHEWFPSFPLAEVQRLVDKISLQRDEANYCPKCGQFKKFCEKGCDTSTVNSFRPLDQGRHDKSDLIWQKEQS